MFSHANPPSRHPSHKKIKAPSLGNQECIKCATKTAPSKGELCSACWYELNMPHLEANAAKVNHTPKANKTKEVVDKFIFGKAKWPSSCSIIPNSIARSSIFGNKEGTDDNFFATSSQKTTQLFYRGKQLSHQHLMVWLGCINQVRQAQQMCFDCSRIDLLRSGCINMKHSRLNEILLDLTSAHIEIEFTIKKELRRYSGFLLKSSSRNKNGSLKIEIDRSIEDIFRKDFTILNLAQNAAMKSRLARALHPYFASHAAKHKSVWVTSDAIKTMCGSRAGERANQWPQQLKRALNELKRFTIIKDYKINKNGAVEFWKK